MMGGVTGELPRSRVINKRLFAVYRMGIRVGVLVLVALLSIGSPAAATPAGAGTGASQRSACSLFSRGDAQRLLGGSVTHSPQIFPKSLCPYVRHTKSGTSQLTVEVTPGGLGGTSRLLRFLYKTRIVKPMTILGYHGYALELPNGPAGVDFIVAKSGFLLGVQADGMADPRGTAISTLKTLLAAL
jgi:hypothetical protein